MKVYSFRNGRIGPTGEMVRNDVTDKMLPIAVAEQSKASVCCCVLVGIAGSNPAGGMEVCIL